MTKFPVYDFLQSGRENAVSLRTIQTVFGLDARTARAEIARERNAGALIMSSTKPPGGYYRPATTDELRGFVASMTSRAKHINRATEAAQKQLEAMGERQRRLPKSCEKLKKGDFYG